MKISPVLENRCGGKCELCNETSSELNALDLNKMGQTDSDLIAVLCDSCNEQMNSEEIADVNKWHNLNETMWSEVPAIKILAYRTLHKLSGESWANDLLDVIYLEDEYLELAKEGIKSTNEGDSIIHKDSNGAQLNAGDSVVLIKDLDVKGANFTAKRGTMVKNISLVDNNPEQIEGKVEGQHIVILTKFVKKQ